MGNKEASENGKAKISAAFHQEGEQGGSEVPTLSVKSKPQRWSLQASSAVPSSRMRNLRWKLRS